MVNGTGRREKVKETAISFIICRYLLLIFNRYISFYELIVRFLNIENVTLSTHKFYDKEKTTKNIYITRNFEFNAAVNGGRNSLYVMLR